jgi:glucose-6-phosphate 1-dehydrogenase
MDHYLGKEMVQVRAQRTIRSVQRATNNMLQPSICNVATINLQRVVVYHWLTAAVALQNLITMRFSNILFEPMWNAKSVSAVLITFKEGFGTHGEYSEGSRTHSLTAQCSWRTR